MEILKILIERLVSWPVAALIMAFVFKKSLTDFLDRIDLFKGPGIEVSAPTGSAKKQKIEAEKSPTEDLLPIALPTKHELPLPRELQNRRKPTRPFARQPQ